LTKEECDAVLAVKTKNLINDVSKRFPKFFTLSTNRQLALLNIAYNIGVSGLFEFVEMFKALRQNDYDKAAEEILDSKAARELPSRYWRISKLMMDG
jgi:lysozyme